MISIRIGRARLFAAPRAGLAAALVLGLAGCADDAPPVTQNFPPLHYEYLAKLRLNVGDIQIRDHSLPVGPQDIASSSPAVPAVALQRMASDRLFAAGTAGTATFVVDQASIVREPSGVLDGHLAVHIDLTGPSGDRRGYAEAQVARQRVPGSDPEDGSAALYTLTRQMMDDMNVEFEYQLRRSLAAWLVTPGSAPAAVVALPLGVPGVPPPAPPPPALPPAVPGDAPAPNSYVDPELPPVPPQTLSPPPGFLQAPQ